MIRGSIPQLFTALSKHNRFSRFAVVGTIGFGIDSGTLQLLFSAANWNIYAARVVSFLLAALVTWMLNRRWTFHVKVPPSRKEWTFYTLCMTLGACINYGVFVLAVYLLPAAAQWPILGVALGSVCAMMVNYMSMHFLFIRRLLS